MINKNSADGPTDISIRYKVFLKKDEISSTIFTGAKVIDGEWFVHRFNWTYRRQRR